MMFITNQSITLKLKGPSKGLFCLFQIPLTPILGD